MLRSSSLATIGTQFTVLFLLTTVMTAHAQNRDGECDAVAMVHSLSAALPNFGYDSKQDGPFRRLESETVPYRVHSGIHSGRGVTPAGSRFGTKITMHGAAWLRLHFDDYNLGESSYILIQSATNNAWQRLDAMSIRQWQGMSAFFNGDVIIIDLYVGSNDIGVFFSIEKATVGISTLTTAEDEEGETSNLGTESGCPETRAQSHHEAVGRALYTWDGGETLKAGCSSWLVSNGALVSASHCAPWATHVVEFNVPNSPQVGEIEFAHPNDQYVVDHSVLKYGGYKTTDDEDWKIYGVFPNSNTQKTPHEAQGGFFRVSYDIGSQGTAVENIGYGVSPVDSLYRVQKSSAGTITSFGSLTFISPTPVSDGNSGGVTYDINSGVAIGIMNWGRGPGPIHCSGRSLRFTPEPLRDALNGFVGVNAYYVDASHPGPVRDGSFFRPFLSVGDGLGTGTPDILSIVSGHYPGAITINQAVKIIATAGNVILGGTGSLLADGYHGSEGRAAVDDAAIILREIVLNAFPNPSSSRAIVQAETPSPLQLTITVYDVLGREVDKVVDAWVDSGGHTWILDTRSLSSGYYLIVARAYDLSITRSLVVVH